MGCTGIKNQPGEPCCESCVLDTQDFAASGSISGFTVEAGAASQAAGVATIDPASVLLARRSTSRLEMAVEAEFSIGTPGACIEFRICWNRTTGAYLFGRVYAAESGLDAGKLEVGKFDGYAETILQGPYYLYSLDAGDVHSAVLCYDGDVVSLRVETAESAYPYAVIPSQIESVPAVAEGNQILPLAPEIPGDFAAPEDGFRAGVVTDAMAGTYELHDWSFELRGAPNPSGEGSCLMCSQCVEYTWGRSIDLNDTWEVLSGSPLQDTYSPTRFIRHLLFDEPGSIRRRHEFQRSSFGQGHRWWFTIGSKDQPASGNAAEFRFWWEDDQNYWYLNVAHDTYLSIHQVVGGVDTVMDTTDFDFPAVQREYFLTICLDRDHVVVSVNPSTFISNFGPNWYALNWYGLGGGVVFAIDNLYQNVPDTSRVGVVVTSTSSGNPFGVAEYQYDCAWPYCSACDKCAEGFGAENYLIEVTGLPCPFDGHNGSYLTNKSAWGVHPIHGADICWYYLDDHDELGTMIKLVGLSLSPITSHPSDPSRTGRLVWVDVGLKVFDPTWKWHPIFGHLPPKEAIAAYCDYGVGGLPPAPPRQGDDAFLLLYFYKWLDDDDGYGYSELPIMCQELDWTIGLTDVYSRPEIRRNGVTWWPNGATQPADLGLDFSSATLRIRSMPLP